MHTKHDQASTFPRPSQTAISLWLCPLLPSTASFLPAANTALHGNQESFHQSRCIRARCNKAQLSNRLPPSITEKIFRHYSPAEGSIQANHSRAPLSNRLYTSTGNIRFSASPSSIPLFPFAPNAAITWRSRSPLGSSTSNYTYLMPISPSKRARASTVTMATSHPIPHSVNLGDAPERSHLGLDIAIICSSISRIYVRILGIGETRS